MKKIIAIILLSLIIITSTVEAKWRKWSHRYGWTNSHGKGGHYYGWY